MDGSYSSGPGAAGQGAAGTVSPRYAKWSRAPTADEIAAFDGRHEARRWRKIAGTDWRCPSCQRTAAELIRWSNITGKTMRARYADAYGMGFTISLAVHHCHGVGRFGSQLMCGDCNNADGAAKRMLSLPESWSFTPQEIARFVQLKPHSGRTLIDYAEAAEIFQNAQGSFS